MKYFSTVCLLATLLTLSGCNFFSQPGDFQTESLQLENAETQIAAVRNTATVSADQLLITLEYAQTSVANVELQSTRISATLMAQGTAFIDVGEITFTTPEPSALDAVAPDGDTTIESIPPTQPDLPAIANPLLTPGAAATLSAVTPQGGAGEGAARGDAPLVPQTPSPVIASPTPDPNAPTLTQIALSTTVGADDCPTNATTSFSSGAAGIYIGAVAQNVTAGTTLSSTWYLEGSQIAFYDWTPDFAINGACVWFYLPAEEASEAGGFLPGNWSVELAVNGLRVGTPLNFSVSGA